MRMKRYASFDDYLKDQSPKNQAIIRRLRRFVKRAEPGLCEAVKWGNGCWVGNNGPVAYVYSATEYVQFGFFNGSSLKDPQGLLEGAGNTCGIPKSATLPESTREPLRRSFAKPWARARSCRQT